MSHEWTNHISSGVGRGAGQFCYEALVVPEVRHAPYVRAMHLRACQSWGRVSAARELPPSIVSYLPIKAMVLLKNTQALVLTKVKGTFQTLFYLFCREIQIRATQMKAGIGFCKHCQWTVTRLTELLTSYFFISSDQSCLLCWKLWTQYGAAVSDITAPCNKNRADEKHHWLWLQTQWVWWESGETD